MRKAKIDTEFKCVMGPVVHVPLVTETHEIKLEGVHIELPSNMIFVLKDGSIFVVTENEGLTMRYTSLSKIIKDLAAGQIIENFDEEKS